jgi:integral membrane protein
VIAILAIHIAAGFVAMYGGLVPALVRKGGASHRRWGRVYVWAMAGAAVTAFPLAYLRSDAFQAGIGLLAGYAAWLGLRTGRSRPPGRWNGVLAASAGVGFAALLTVRTPVALVFGLLGLGLAARDLHGLWKGSTLPGRIVDHILATTLGLVVAWSSFLNTQMPRLTGLHWGIEAKMFLPFVVALPLLAYWLPQWHRRLRTEGVKAWAGGREPSELERLRGFGIAEGVSFLLLLFVAVPLKRIGGEPAFVRVMGPVHGALVVLYVTSVFLAARSLGWRWPRVLGALGAGVLPFGTFVFEARLRRERA